MLDGKLPMPDIARSANNIAARPEVDMPHSTFIILEKVDLNLLSIVFYKAVDLNMKRFIP